jgi:Flp pilus assembly protein CpaB
MAVRTMSLSRTIPHLDRRYLIGGILAGLAAILVLMVTHPPERTPVLVAGSDLVAGTPLAALDVGVRWVENPEGLVQGDSIGELGDWSLTIALAAGEPILASTIRPPEVVDAPHVFALALPSQHAALGRISSGDRIDIYLTSSGGFDTSAATVLVASEIYVVAVESSERAGGDPVVSMLLAVDDELAPILANAIHSGTIDVVRRAP